MHLQISRSQKEDILKLNKKDYEFEGKPFMCFHWNSIWFSMI